LTSQRRDRIEAALEDLARLRVLVVGDLLLDEYRRGDVDRISPEAPVPVLRVHESEVRLGGAANVARNVVSLGARARLVGLAGQDREGDVLVDEVAALGMAVDGILRTPDRPTTHKVRMIARAQQMLRLDREEDGALSADQEEALRRAVASALEDCDVVVVEDYDKGIFAGGLGRWVIELARRRGVPVAADPKRDPGRFRGASLVKPNLEEAARFVGGRDAERPSRRGGSRTSGPGPAHAARRSVGRETLRGWLEKLRDALGGSEVVVTRGPDGMSALDATGRFFDVPTRPLEVFDVQGAGDTSIAALALCRAAGAELADACIVANAAAAVAVEKVGTATVSRAELRDRLADGIALFEARP
jgi:D-beta-D-heptose 7-phosphate kinase/D-beta-D-heptose 1-phosphate adenosyltransferase